MRLLAVMITPQEMIDEEPFAPILIVADPLVPALWIYHRSSTLESLQGTLSSKRFALIFFPLPIGSRYVNTIT